MEHGGPPEKWAATQCLALSGVITDKVIVELVNHLHADNAVRTEKAGTLLAKLSQQSVSFTCYMYICTVRITHLMTGPKRNSLFCCPRIFYLGKH